MSNAVAKPEELKDKLSEVSLGQDDKGYYVYTHRARSDSYNSPEAIPDKDIEFISSTGSLRLNAWRGEAYHYKEIDDGGNVDYYNENNERHRTDNPTIEYADGYKAWYQNNKLHRTDGPAVEYASGTKEWWVNDKLYGRSIDGYTQEQFDKDLIGGITSNLKLAWRTNDNPYRYYKEIEAAAVDNNIEILESFVLGEYEDMSDTMDLVKYNTRDGNTVYTIFHPNQGGGGFVDPDYPMTFDYQKARNIFNSWKQEAINSGKRVDEDEWYYVDVPPSKFHHRDQDAFEVENHPEGFDITGIADVEPTTSAVISRLSLILKSSSSSRRYNTEVYREKAKSQKLIQSIDKSNILVDENDGEYGIIFVEVKGEPYGRTAKEFTYRVDDPDKKLVPAGYWMDMWESEFGITERKYNKLPIQERARLEAKLQLDKYVPYQYWSLYADFYHPGEYENWWFDEGGAEKAMYGDTDENQYWMDRLNSTQKLAWRDNSERYVVYQTSGGSVYPLFVKGLEDAKKWWFDHLKAGNVRGFTYIQSSDVDEPDTIVPSWKDEAVLAGDESQLINDWWEYKNTVNDSLTGTCIVPFEEFEKDFGSIHPDAVRQMLHSENLERRKTERMNDWRNNLGVQSSLQEDYVIYDEADGDVIYKETYSHIRGAGWRLDEDAKYNIVPLSKYIKRFGKTVTGKGIDVEVLDKQAWQSPEIDRGAQGDPGNFFSAANCDRCGGDLKGGRKMSWFNNDTICMNCADIESDMRKTLHNNGAEYEGIGYVPNKRQAWKETPNIEELDNQRVNDPMYDGYPPKEILQMWIDGAKDKSYIYQQYVEFVVRNNYGGIVSNNAIKDFLATKPDTDRADLQTLLDDIFGGGTYTVEGSLRKDALMFKSWQEPKWDSREYQKDDTVVYKDDQGLLHREDGPAMEWPEGSTFWFQHGKKHRVGGPAIHYKSDGLEEWWQNGQLHRIDGPAIVTLNGDNEYYLFGHKIEDRDAFIEILKKLKEPNALDELHNTDLDTIAKLKFSWQEDLTPHWNKAGPFTKENAAWREFVSELKLKRDLEEIDFPNEDVPQRTQVRMFRSVLERADLTPEQMYHWMSAWGHGGDTWLLDNSRVAWKTKPKRELQGDLYGDIAQLLLKEVDWDKANKLFDKIYLETSKEFEDTIWDADIWDAASMDYIIRYGSTPGLGYFQLVPADATPEEKLIWDKAFWNLMNERENYINYYRQGSSKLAWGNNPITGDTEDRYNAITSILLDKVNWEGLRRILKRYIDNAYHIIEEESPEATPEDILQIALNTFVDNNENSLYGMYKKFIPPGVSNEERLLWKEAFNEIVLESRIPVTSLSSKTEANMSNTNNLQLSKHAWKTTLRPTPADIAYIKNKGRMPQALFDAMGLDLNNWGIYVNPDNKHKYAIGGDIFRFLIAEEDYQANEVLHYSVDYEDLIEENINPFDWRSVTNYTIGMGPDEITEDTTIDELLDDEGADTVILL